MKVNTEVGFMNQKKEIINKLRAELKKYDKPQYKANYQRFFKEKLKNPIGLRTPIVRKVSNLVFKEAKHLSKKELFQVCEILSQSGRDGEKVIGFDWVSKISPQYTKSDFRIFESWLKKYVNGWGSCDHICCSIIGPFLYMYPEFVKKSTAWTRSKNQWFRRAAAVSLIYSLRKNKQLKTAFKVADILMMDEKDLVQKGYGWMLKVAADSYRKEVFDYVVKHKAVMPRTALRYAIEKMPPQMRKKAMSRD
jgi:3-methyladenine DNA glycosylase AlkD